MAYITIKANGDECSMTLTERVSPSDMASEFFARICSNVCAGPWRTPT